MRRSTKKPRNFVSGKPLPHHQIVPLAETTIYEMERRGDFPRRFNLTPRCVVWDLEEVEAWIEERKRESRSGKAPAAPGPDVRQRIARPVRSRNN
jgi:prophage regulatory protein